MENIELHYIYKFYNKENESLNKHALFEKDRGIVISKERWPHTYHKNNISLSHIFEK